MTCYVTGEIRKPLLATLAAVLVAAAFVAPPAAAGKPKQEPFELINPLVSPEHSQWLMGPISWMASKKEIEQYLAIVDDAQADAFIKSFWAERDPYPERPDNPLRTTFEERAVTADSLYAEGGLPGRRTDRGTIYVLYGEPDEVDRRVSPDLGDPLMEVWIYEKGAEKGLDGERPDREYRFVKRDDTTRFYLPLSEYERKRRQSRRLPDPRRPVLPY